MEEPKLHSVEGKRAPMEKYMLNQFEFIGVPQPDRKAQTKDWLKQSKKAPLDEVLQLFAKLYGKSGREYKYVAIDLALANVRRFTFENIQLISKFLLVDAWWETVDTLRKVFSEFVLRNPESEQRVFDLFAGQENFWMRRVAITLQLQFKQRTNQKLLTAAIEPDLTTDEFFIQKAIGWALREYSKTNSDWVRQFITGHQLSKLAQREASKYL